MGTVDFHSLSRIFRGNRLLVFNRPGKAKTKQGQDKSKKGSALKNFKATFTPLPWNIAGFEKGVLTRCADLLPEFGPCASLFPRHSRLF
jgi:hypothetical protein